MLRSHEPFSHIPDLPLGLDAALSFAMAMSVAFRVNRSYERWWEARKLWGTLVNVSRNLAVKVGELHEPDAEDRRAMRDLIVAFCRGLKDHLRDEADVRRLPALDDVKTTPDHVPSFIARRVYALFHRWKKDGKLTDQQIWVLDSEARVLLDVCGGCERIKTTLMSASWRNFALQAITLYLLVLPWSLVENFDGWVIPITIIVAYFVLAAEVIARYVEEPFGFHEDHLDLDRICGGIDSSVTEVLIGDAATTD